MKCKRNQIGALTLVIVAALFFALPLRAQVTIGSQQTPDTNALLDLKQDGTANKGLLLPRVALVALNDPSPLANHVKGMLVYNTATDGSGATAVSPGVYYNDGTQWVTTLATAQTTASRSLKVDTLTTSTYTVTDADIILMTDATPANFGTVTITLPTGDYAPVGRTLYIVNNSQSNQINLVPAGYYINSTAGVFNLQARMLVYLGNGQWQNFSGDY